MQGKGFGTALLNAIKSQYKVLNGWVISHSDYITSSGATYLSPLPFYLNQHFEIVPDKALDNGKIKAVQVVWRVAQ